MFATRRKKSFPTVTSTDRAGISIEVGSLGQRSFPLRPQLGGAFAGALLPQLLAVFTLPHRRVQLGNDLFVVILRHPVEKVCRDTVAAVVSGMGGIVNVCAVRLRFVLEPPDVVGDSFDKPTGI